MSAQKLSQGDLYLARKLAADLAYDGVKTVPLACDEIQAGDGWTFDLGRAGGSTHWQRIEGYRAGDWNAVKARVEYWLADPSYYESY